MFDFAAFIRIIKGWSRGLTEYDDDNDKVWDTFEEKVDFDVSPISFPWQKETKIKKFLLFVDLNVEENDLYNLIVVELV